MNSIRRRLLLTVLAMFAGAWMLVTLFTYIAARHEVEEIFDAQLAQEAGILAEVTLEGFKERGGSPAILSRAVYGHKYERYIGFQIWRQDELLLRSNGAPDGRLSTQMGFVDRQLDGVRWRVFGMRDASSDYLVLVAESYQARDELIQDIALGTLLPMLLALPLTGILLWVGIRRGLLPLDQMAGHLAQRSPLQLEPLPIQGVPLELRPLTLSLNDLLRRLEQAFEAERHFAADASHELRTPLASIRIQAQVALRSRDDAERAQALHSVIRGVDRSTRLVEQMLDLARLEMGSGGDDTRQVLEPESLLRQVLADLAPQARQAAVEVSLELGHPGRGPIAATGHGPGISVLIRNLVDNAIRHSPAGSRVTVTLEPVGRSWRLRVEDEGPGIEAAERERVFDTFYRGAGQSGVGSGLGLSIVRRIAGQHGARIELEPGAGGRGTRISVEFP
jgi:two-component system sensor histidine kinase QseC